MIAQIKLLQLASNNYSFTQDSHFREWFAGVEKLSEAERSVHYFYLFVFSGCSSFALNCIIGGYEWKLNGTIMRFKTFFLCSFQLESVRVRCHLRS